MHCFTHSALREVYGFPTQPCPALIAIEPLFDVGWTVQGHSGSFMAEGRCEPYSHLFPVQPSISPPHQWPPTCEDLGPVFTHPARNVGIEV